MVSSSSFTLFLDLNISKAKKEYEEAKRDIEKIGATWRKTKDLIKRESRAILGTMKTLINIGQNVMERMGFVLDPFQEYITGLINITITTLLQMSIAASSTGIGIPLGVAIAASAGIFGIASHAMASAGIAEAKGDIENLEATMRDLGTLVSSLSQFGG